MFSDSQVMSGRYGHVSITVLREMVSEAEAAQSTADPVADCETHVVGFSTALTDEERRYLDLCAELYARVGDAAGRQPCEGEQPEEMAA